MISNLSPSRPAHDRPLTRTEREYLQQLRLRQRQKDGSQGAFVFSLRRGRMGLIVRTTFNAYETHLRFAKNQRTLDLLSGFCDRHAQAPGQNMLGELIMAIRAHQRVS